MNQKETRTFRSALESMGVNIRKTRTLELDGLAILQLLKEAGLSLGKNPQVLFQKESDRDFSCRVTGDARILVRWEEEPKEKNSSHPQGGGKK